MRHYSRFDDQIWLEPWFRELPDDSPLLWLWLNHNRHISPCGLWRVDLRQAANETLLPVRDIARWLSAWGRLGLLRGDGTFILLPRFSGQQCITPDLQRRAMRDAIVLGCETHLAVEWLEAHRGQAVDGNRAGTHSRGQRTGR